MLPLRGQRFTLEPALAPDLPPLQEVLLVPVEREQSVLSQKKQVITAQLWHRNRTPSKASHFL